jgi:cation transport regulator ChaB
VAGADVGAKAPVGVNLPGMNALPLAQIEIEDLPPEVVDELPSDIVDQIKDGLLDKLPEDVVAELPNSLQDRIPEGLLEAASSNPTFTKVLLVIGVLAVIGFIFGVIKSAVKWMLYSAILGVAAWYFFFQM